MMNKASYSVIQFVPDPVRKESLNLGVIVIADGEISVRMTSSFQRLKKLYPTADTERFAQFEEVWEDWISTLAYENEVSPSTALSQVSESLTHQTQLSEPRQIEVQESIDTERVRLLTDELYERLVATPDYAVVKRPKKRRRIKTTLNRQFRSMNLLNKVIYEGQWIDGRTPHPVTYRYENGHIVAIETMDLHFQKLRRSRAQLIDAAFGIWTDIADSRGDEVERVSIVQYVKDHDFSKYIDHLSQVSTVFVSPEETDKLVSKVKEDFPEHIPPEFRDDN